MIPTRRGAPFALGAVLASGCSLIYGGDLDDANKASAADASSPEASSMTDAKATDGGVHGCASLMPAPMFCQDFDHVTAIETGWTRVNRNGGNSQLDPSTFFSPLKSAKVTVTAKKGCQYSRLEKELNGIGTTRLQVHMRVRPTPPWNNFIPLVVSTKAQSGDCGALLYLQSNGAGVIDATQLNVQSASPANDQRAIDGIAALNQWTGVDMVITPVPTGGLNYHVTITPESGAASDTDLVYTQCKTWTSAGIYVGFHCQNEPGTVSYDDVWADSR